MAIAHLPRRDEAARARLEAVATRGAPLVLARDRVLAVPGELGGCLAGCALQRGSVVTISGRQGSGVVSTALVLAAAATAAGEWAAVVEIGELVGIGGLTAHETGVDLGRFAVVRDVPAKQWATVVAALLDGISVVIAGVPHGVRLGDARRLVARARERGAVLVAVGSWPAQSSVRIEPTCGAWVPLHDGQILAARPYTARVFGRGMPDATRPRPASAVALG